MTNGRKNKERSDSNTYTFLRYYIVGKYLIRIEYEIKDKSRNDDEKSHCKNKSLELFQILLSENK